VKFSYKGIYNLQEHLQSAFTKIKCNIRLKFKERITLQPKNEKNKLEVGKKKTKLNNTINIILKKKQ
jgi:hypothetical protein